MTDEPLSPGVAADLQRILDTEIPMIPTGQWILDYWLPVETLICLDCGHVNPKEAIICAQCDKTLNQPCGPDASAYLTATDLLRSGELAPADVHALLAKIQRGYSFYGAGTKYAVFGRA
ncbi:MAG: hypothetical protein KKA73_29435 [Chloroflexi bacterium]|nr:hypothetical protein [Chloroflexota bacterium]MBU1751820.1 hypothetical protein [Chloroflexota bacterium]